MTNDPQPRSRVARTRVLAIVAVCAVTLAVWGMARVERRTVDESFDQIRSAEQMLRAMLDQEAGFRGFAQTRREDSLERYHSGLVEFEAAVATARRTADDQLRQRIDRQVTAAREWRTWSDETIGQLRSQADATVTVDTLQRDKTLFDQFRQRNRDVQSEVASEIDRELARAETGSSGVVLGLSLLFGAIGYVAIERQAARSRRRQEREQRYRASQSEFSQTMQVMRDEDEAYDLVKRHLERTISAALVTVLNRNNSDNRIVAATPVPPDSALAEGLVDATPESCLAIRLGRVYRRGNAEEPLLACSLCVAGSEKACVPSLVSGEVIGSVLVQREQPLDAEQSERIAETVRESSPVLANLRNLAIAEVRAATDALTGLPNARSCRDTLKRMVAHAGRSVSPLSAVMLDLDHFKQVNDRFGHGAGDDVLAATGAVLQAALRASDFAGRHGGEEFLMLLPDTDAQGAVQVAQKVREAIAQVAVPQVDRAITASLGVATYPYDAADADSLLRQADRALYAAKAAGRNRVELARTAPPDAIDAPDETSDAALR